MGYTGEVQIGGRLAAVGQRLIDTVAKSIISQAFETLDNVLAERVAAAEEDREVSYERPLKVIMRPQSPGIFGSPWVKWAVGIGILVVIGLILLFSLPDLVKKYNKVRMNGNIKI